MHLYKLNTNIKIKDNFIIENFINPDFIYIPYYANIKLDNIFINTKINNYKSSISGKIIDIKKGIFNEKYQNVFVIANDFKEKENKKEPKTKVNIDNIKKVLKENNEIKLLNRFTNLDKLDNIVISAINDEINVFNNVYLLKENTRDLLDLIDDLRINTKCKNNYLVIKNDESYIIDECLNLFGTYPLITLTLVEDLYLLEKKEFLLDKLNINGNTLYLTIEELDTINRYLKGLDTTTKLITISDNKTCKVIRAKKYTLISDLIKYAYKDLKYNHIIINGLMTGYEITDSNNYILDDEIKSIHLLQKIPKQNNECINCGLCLKVCPKKVDMINSKNLDKCIDCGLCSFMCPNLVNLRAKIKDDKNE